MRLWPEADNRRPRHAAEESCDATDARGDGVQDVCAVAADRSHLARGRGAHAEGVFELSAMDDSGAPRRWQREMPGGKWGGGLRRDVSFAEDASVTARGEPESALGCFDPRRSRRGRHGPAGWPIVVLLTRERERERGRPGWNPGLEGCRRRRRPGRGSDQIGRHHRA